MKTGMKVIVLHEGGPPETCDSFAVVLNKEDELHAYIQMAGTAMDSIGMAQALTRLAHDILEKLTNSPAQEVK